MQTLQPLVVQQLRDAAEDHRVDPEGAPDVTVHLDGGRVLTGAVLAVEDGAAYLQLPGSEEATPVDLHEIVSAG